MEHNKTNKIGKRAFQLFLNCSIHICIICLFPLSSKAQDFKSMSSININYEKFYIQEQTLSEVTGPVGVTPQNSEGRRLSLGYSYGLTMTDQITMGIGIGRNSYNYALNIEPNPYPNSGNYLLTAIPLTSLRNYSLSIAYTKSLLKTNHFGISASGGFDFVAQGGGNYISSYQTTNSYNFPAPPVQPDTILFMYKLTSLESDNIQVTPNLSLKIDFAYWINQHNKLNFGVGYNYWINNLASGNYIIYAETPNQSTGNWKLRGNSFSLGISYQYVFYKKKK